MTIRFLKKPIRFLMLPKGSLSLLFILNLLWFQGHGFQTLMGDDLVRWSQVSQLPSPSSCFSFIVSETKYRPVNDLIHYALIQAFGSSQILFFYFNVLFNFAIVASLYSLVRNITSGDGVIAVSVSVLYLTSRFAYWDILSLSGVLELISLLLLILLVDAATRLIQTGRTRYLALVCSYHLLLVFNHERFIVLLPAIALLILFFERSGRPSIRGAFILAAAFPLALNYSVKTFAFGLPFLQRSQDHPLDFNLLSVSRNFAAGLLNVLSVNVGPEYLNMVAFDDATTLTKVLSIASASFISIVFVAAASQLFKLSPDQRREEVKVGAVWAVLFGSLLLSGAIAFIVEPRWIYPAFVAFLIYFAYIYKRYVFTIQRAARYVPLCCLCLMSVKNDTYYKSHLPNTFFVRANMIADSFHEQTVKEYGRRLSERAIFVERFRDYEYVFQGSLYFSQFFPDKDLQIYYFDGVADLPMAEMRRDKTLIFVLEPNSRRMQNVTEDAFALGTEGRVGGYGNR